MKLYGFPASPNTWKVRAAAHQIGVPLELEIVDLTKGAQRKPEYLALNPTGRTPTLVDFTVVAPPSHAEPAKIPLEKYGNIKRWFGAQASLPAWQETAPRR